MRSSLESSRDVSRHCGIQQFHDMRHALSSAVELYTGAQLENAPRICRSDDAGARAVDRFHFALEQLHGQFGFRNIVDACAAATEIGERHLDQPQPWHRIKELAGL